MPAAETGPAPDTSSSVDASALDSLLPTGEDLASGNQPVSEDDGRYDIVPPDQLPTSDPDDTGKTVDQAAAKDTPDEDAPEKPAEPAQKPITLELAQRAAHYGLTPDKMARFGSPSAIEAHLDHLDELRNRGLEQQRRLQAPPEDKSKAVVDALKQRAAAKFDRQKLIADGFDESLVNQLEALHKQQAEAWEYAASLAEHTGAQQKFIAEQAQRQQQIEQYVTQQEQVRNQQAWNHEFDGYVKAEEGPWKDILAEPESQAKLNQKIGMLAVGYAQVGMPVPGNKELYDEAKHAVFGNQLQQHAREDVRSEVAERNGRSVARARQSARAAPPRGVAAAENRLDNFYRKAGFSI